RGREPADVGDLVCAACGERGRGCGGGDIARARADRDALRGAECRRHLRPCRRHRKRKGYKRKTLHVAIDAQFPAIGPDWPTFPERPAVLSALVAAVK